ncbi:MAG TPA: DUF4251 domain-containing protein [Bacteroidales bacterium]|nr:DUF4251 domain-containing protein [Bacteroidales bacterium]
MRLSLIIILSLLVVFLIPAELSAQEKRKRDKREQKEPVKLNYEEIKKMVHLGLYIFTAKEIKPVGRSRISLISNYYEVSVEYYDVYAYLPSFRRYQPYSIGSNDIEVEGKLDQLFIEEKDSRKIVRVKFRVLDQGAYIFNFTIFENGYTELTLTTPRGSLVTYSGKTEPLEPEVDQFHD